MGQAINTTRITATIPNDMHVQLQYWANKKGISVNQYLYEALERAIAWENQDYPLPTLEAARLNQLVELIGGLKADINNLQNMTNTGFDSLLTLTKGDNYLLDTDDGDIE